MHTVVATFGLVMCWLACAASASAQQPTVPQRINADTAGVIQLRLYFSPIRVDSGYRLTPYSYSGTTHVEQTVNFAERPDSVHVTPVVGVAARSIDTWNGIQFVSPQLAGPFELSGAFCGRLDLRTNKQHFDFQISLYELTPSGDYILVSQYSNQRAAGDSSHRILLQPGSRQHLDYASDARTSRTIQNGDRLVVLLSILREADTSLADATELLRVGWYGESYIELRVRHL